MKQQKADFSKKVRQAGKEAMHALQKDARDFFNLKKPQSQEAKQTMSLVQLRSYQKHSISSLLSEHSHTLCHFDEVMEFCVMGSRYPQFVDVRAVSDFCDGFMISKGHCKSAKVL